MNGISKAMSIFDRHRIAIVNINHKYAIRHNR